MDHGRAQQEGIVEKYVHGSLSPKEKESFEEHFFVCEQCIQEVHQKIADEEFIDRYVLRKLSEPERNFFEEHYFACAHCFAEASAAQELIAGLKESARRSELAPIQMKSPFVLPDWLKFFQSPIIATAAVVLVLTLIYPAYRGFVKVSQLQGKLVELEQPQANAKNYLLEPTQDRSRGIAAIRIPITSRNETFILKFSITERTIAAPKYRAEIVDQQGRIIWRKQSLAGLVLYEVFTIVCRGSFFKAGTYTLQVHEMNPQNDQITKTFIFPFEVVLAERPKP